MFGARVAVGNGAETAQSTDSQRREIEVLHRLVAEARGGQHHRVPALGSTGGNSLSQVGAALIGQRRLFVR